MGFFTSNEDKAKFAAWEALKGKPQGKAMYEFLHDAKIIYDQIDLETVQEKI